MITAGTLIVPTPRGTATTHVVVSCDGETVVYAPKDFNYPHMRKSAPLSLILARVAGGTVRLDNDHLTDGPESSVTMAPGGRYEIA